MTRGRVAFAALAVLLSALFIRLGIWQLDRHGQRLEEAGLRDSRAALPPVDLSRALGEGEISLPSDAAEVWWRSVRLSGQYDRAHEILLRSRSLAGRPGVELLTPLVLDLPDAREGTGAKRAPTLAVLVIRGWLPAPDGLRPRLTDAWPPGRPSDSEAAAVTVEGVAVPGSEAASAPVRVEIEGAEHAAVAAVDLEAIADLLPYGVAPFYLRATDPGVAGPGLAPPPPLPAGSGPHLSYAVQWFSFALIALVGTAILIRKERAR